MIGNMRSDETRAACNQRFQRIGAEARISSFELTLSVKKLAVDGIADGNVKYLTRPS